MAGSAVGYALAAGGIVAANDAIFIPMETGQAPWTGLNWRIVPATAFLALALDGLDRLAPGFGKGLAVLVLISALVIPFGNSGTPLQNAAKLVGNKK
jgi:hypothetical protein